MATATASRPRKKKTLARLEATVERLTELRDKADDVHYSAPYGSAKRAKALTALDAVQAKLDKAREERDAHPDYVPPSAFC